MVSSMEKADKKITERCQILEKVIIDVAKTYFDENTNDDQKKLIETMIGAAIFYLPQGDKYWTGKLSKEAIEKLKQDPKTKITKEHQYPRKIAARDLLEKYKEISSGKESILNLYESEYGLFNYVLPQENKRLAAFQRDSVFVDIETSYNKAGVELISITVEEFNRLKKK